MFDKQRQAILRNLASLIQAYKWTAVLCLLLGVAASGHAQQPSQETASRAAVNQALSQETGMSVDGIEAVLGEIETMKRSRHAAVISVPIKAVTPERLSRIFAAPSIAKLPTMTRINGLIFAGQPGSKLMTFDKPSDVIRKGEHWFSAELSNARNKGTGSSHFELMGPYANWTTEAAAFTAVWNCMPKSVWLHPARAPFSKTDGENMMLPLIAEDSGEADTAVFKRCVREWSGREPEIPPQQHEALDALANKVELFLGRKFAAFLKTNRCNGVGVDDCVLVLNWWSSLSPEDPLLAEMLQSLAKDVGMMSPLPVADDPAMAWKVPQPRYDEVWRREAFVHSKLLSIFKAPKAWPSGALISAMRELDALDREIQKTMYRYGPPTVVHPFAALRAERRPENIHTNGLYRSRSRRPAWELQPRDAATIKRVDTAVMSLLNDPATNGDCGAVKRWLSTEMEIQRLNEAISSTRSLPTCLDVDWAWLRQGTGELATTTREFISKSLADAKPVLRDQLLENLTTDGRKCVAADPPATNRWLEEMCKKWMPGPNEVDFRLEKAEQGQLPSRDFFVHEISFSDEKSNHQRMSSLRTLSEGMPTARKKPFATLLASLKHKLSEYRSAAIWRHNGHSRSLLQLTRSNGGNPIDHYYLLSPTEAKEIHVSERFASRFDGNRIGQKLARVSDRDQDGQLELWWANPYEVSSLSKCAGDDSDLDRDMQCRGGVIRAEIGEIDGDALSYVRLNPQPKDVAPAGKASSFKPQLAKIPPSWRAPPFPGPTCNPVLIGSVLGPALGIADWGKNSEDAKSVLSLTCKAHPLHPELTIVALFHNLPKGQEKSSEKMPEFGFAFGVIDIKRNRVARLYQSQIEQDASLSIWGENQLEIDTGRYWLKRDVRALGVRMSIAGNPSAADGGSNNYLTLFVEEGQALRPVLEFMPTYLWSYVGVDGCVDPKWASEERGDIPCDYASSDVTLAVESVKGQEWRDLIARVGSGSGKPPRQVRLRYENGRYPSPGLSLEP